MADYTVLGWQNENGLSNYPFIDPFDIQDLFVDAAFIQFDNFTPTLSSVQVGTNYIDVSIIFDDGLAKSRYTSSENNAGVRELRFYSEIDDRYLGVITLGSGVSTAWSYHTGQNLQKNLKFISTTVRSIPSNSAVYKLDGSYGDITLGATQDLADVYTEIGGIVYQSSAGGNTVFYNFESIKKNITFNAVANHKIPANNGIYPLKKINLVNPIKNNVYISSNDVIKFSSINNQNLSIYLVGQNISGSAILPSTLAN
jgi:hypothetical protein